MTRMPYFHSSIERGSQRNPVKPLEPPIMARSLHRFAAAVPGLLSLLLVGCIFPPSLSVERMDAGQNSPPGIVKITADTQELDEPGPPTGVTFKIGQGTLDVQLVDTDLSDTLYVRVFVDYDANTMMATSPRANCSASPGTSAVRTASCSLIALCTAAELSSLHDMTVVVFDRMVDDTLQPPLQNPGPDGLTASKYFHLKCTS
jgi:hypothetical protein